MSQGYLTKAINNGQFIIIAEYRPPRGPDVNKLRTCATTLGGLVHAVYAPESEDGVRLSSLAACSHLAAAGAEPILGLLTRDMNRIALQSALLGAASLGIGNIFCLPGRHQTLTSSVSARGAYDIDPIQLLKVADSLRHQGRLADGQTIDGQVALTLGTDTNPFADPLELHLMILEKAVAAGADYVMTQPVFDLERFGVWMDAVRGRGLHRKVCIIASVMPVTSADEAAGLAEKHRYFSIPCEFTDSLRNSPDQQGAGIQIAAKTVARLRSTEGVRGINLITGDDYGTAADILKAGGLSRS